MGEVGLICHCLYSSHSRRLLKLWRQLSPPQPQQECFWLLEDIGLTEQESGFVCAEVRAISEVKEGVVSGLLRFNLRLLQETCYTMSFTNWLHFMFKVISFFASTISVGRILEILIALMIRNLLLISNLNLFTVVNIHLFPCQFCP